MPLLEIVQTQYINATIRLIKKTAEHIDQYATLVHASPMKLWTKLSHTYWPRIATSRNTFGVQKLPELSRAFECAALRRMGQALCDRRSVQPAHEPWRLAVNRASATLDHLPEPAKRNSHEVSRYNQRWVLNQLVSNPGICSKVCPLSQISSVPFQARKFCDE